MMDDSYYMRLAIAVARVGISKGNSPFGAVIVDLNGNTIAYGHNQVIETGDPSAHAEIITIRKATKSLSNISHDVIDMQGDIVGHISLKNLFLQDYTLYSTTESCLMCWGAAHWARIKKIVYGVSLNIAAQYGFNELKIYNKQLKEITGSKIEIIDGILEKENMRLFEDWKKTNGKIY